MVGFVTQFICPIPFIRFKMEWVPTHYETREKLVKYMNWLFKLIIVRFILFFLAVFFFFYGIDTRLRLALRDSFIAFIAQIVLGPIAIKMLDTIYRERMKHEDFIIRGVKDPAIAPDLYNFSYGVSANAQL